MTLIPDAYTSEAFYKIEQEQAVGTSWVMIGCLSEFKEAGDAVVATVDFHSLSCSLLHM
ncbi:MAG: hypothetical protein AAF702_29915 [Chloroflexota bacterium]